MQRERSLFCCWYLQTVRTVLRLKMAFGYRGVCISGFRIRLRLLQAEVEVLTISRSFEFSIPFHIIVHRCFSGQCYSLHLYNVIH